MPGIILSDPANPSFYRMTISIIKHLQEKYPGEKITVAFHKGYTTDDNIPSKQTDDFVRDIEKLGITHKDISGSADGFSIYDNCKLHIGFRVHAHIYNLSQRYKTVLISEDLRGDSLNQTLGLPCISSYNEQRLVYKNKYMAKGYSKLFNQDNPHILQELDSYFALIDRTDGKMYEWAFERMRFYFDAMVAHLKSIESVL